VKKLSLLALPAAATAALIAAAPAYAAAPSVTVSPSSNVANNSTVTVKGTGFSPNTALVVLECKTNPTGAADCDTGNIANATSDAQGAISATLKVKTGVGGGCAAGGGCVVSVANPAKQTETASGAFTFAAAGGGGGSTSTATASPTSSATQTGGAAPTAVAAGSGGQAGSDDDGVPAGVIVLAGAGAIGLAVGARRFARR
jgi:hypothetical protein